MFGTPDCVKKFVFQISTFSFLDLALAFIQKDLAF